MKKLPLGNVTLALLRWHNNGKLLEYKKKVSPSAREVSDYRGAKSITNLERVHADASVPERPTSYVWYGKGHREVLAAFYNLGQGRGRGQLDLQASLQKLLRRLVERNSVRCTQRVFPGNLGWIVDYGLVVVVATIALKNFGGDCGWWWFICDAPWGKGHLDKVKLWKKRKDLIRSSGLDFDESFRGHGRRQKRVSYSNFYRQFRI